MPILKEYKEKNDSLFQNEEGTPLTETETDNVIDEMISYFENGIVDDNVIFDSEELSIKEILEIERRAKENRQKGLALFSKWFDCLWF